MRDFPERLVALQPFWGLWQLEEFIGEGSYGKVYRIKREEFGETYYAALKWICLPQNQSEIQSLRNEGYDDASIADHYTSVIKAFQSEIVLMSKLRGHSHIVSFEDHLFEKRENELGWDILIRMELLESLPGFFKKDRAVRDVITLGCDICDALTLCAKYKIVHRDIKPDNIFVNENGDFKLGDFGVARQMEHTQTNMSRKGTPFFMAPEVYTGREADARADQYSLGLVMHRLLNAQQIPFAPAFDRILTHQEREEALLQRLRGEALPPPLQGSEKLKQIILKASNYQPKKRFAAPEEMKAALQQTLNERENQASLFKAASGQISSKRSSLRPEAAFKKGKKSKRDKKDKTGWVLGILVGLILLLTGTGIWLLLQTSDEDVPASFENTIPAVQTPVPSTARTPMPTATPVPIDPIETLAAVLTSTPTIAPTFTPTPTATPTSAPTATPTVTPTPAPTPAEESLASEYTYHFDGMRYSTNQVYQLLWRITVNPYEIAEEIPAIYQLIRGEDAAWLSPDYSYDWQLSAEAAEVFGSSVQKDYLNTVLKDHVYIVVTPEKEMAALGLIGKQVLTLTISRKSDDTVMTKVNCVLDSFACETRVIAFTPGKPVTITLPQDEIASTYDDAKVIYEWWRLPVDSVPINMTEWAGLTSYTFTPEADWDGDTVYTVVYREGMRGDGYTSIVCILKSDDTSSAQPAPTTQPEASDVPVSSEGNFEYRIDEAGNAVITKYTGSDTICRVPETLDGRTVVSIEGKLNESAFMECVNLQYVLLPNTIQSVGQFAFFKCDSLIGVSLPESLTSIGYSAFRDCVSLEDIVFPDTITFIGRSAFGNCLLLEHLTLSENLETLSASAFAGCRALTSVILPDSLTYIDHCVFDGCSSITNISLPTNLKKIGWAAFRNCSSLSSLVLPDGLIEIEFEAFDGCRKLKYLYIPASSIEEIGVNEGISFAFDESITLVCPENSYAEKYARENGLSYINGDYDTWKALVEKAENPSSSPIPTATPTAAHTPMPTPVEESLASEYMYHFNGTRYTPKSGTISAFTGLIAQEIPDIDKLIMEDSAAGLLRTDYNYDWQLSAEIAAVLDSSFEIEKEDRWCQMVFWQEDADTVLGLIGKTVFTLTISKKSDNTVLTKVNCVLDSLLCNIEWENDEYIEQEIVFTPGQSLTITLPQDKIAYTHDGTTVIYDWLQSTDKVSYYELVSGADCTSVTFTPKASWDGTYIEPNVRNENEFGSSIPLGITYILKSDGTQPASGVPVVEESIASEYTYHIVGDRYGRVKGVMSNEFSISLMPDVIACEIADLYPLIVGDYGELSPDYLYEWELAKGIDAIMDCWSQDANVYLTSWPAEEEPLALELIGKTIATLTISKKSDNAVMTRVNCVLDSFIYAIEWENHDSVEQEIIFTPGQPVTISLPEDRIASTYDGATLIYMWDRSLGDSYYTITSGAGLTSITFTPEADWDGTWILPYVYREDAPHDAPNLNMIEISYILKSSGTSSAQPASTTQPEASGVSVSSEGNFEYRIDESGNAVITKYTGSETICRVPATLDGRTVVSIEGNRSKSAFEDCVNLQYVLLPDTIQSVGQFAFFKCDSLIGVSLPESLISIEHSAFKDCTSLEDIVFPDAITFIGSSAFHGCLSLQDITLPRNLEKMQAMAFAYCTVLTSVFCSDSLAYIDAGTFKGCTSLKKVTLPGNLDRIGLSAFRDCKELSSIALSEHIKVIEHAAFEGCEKLDYIYIPASVEKIGVGGDGTLAFDEATTLIGPENSCAEKYAKQYNLQYNVPISQEDNFQVRINADGNAVITKYLGSEAVCNVPEIMAGRKVVAIGANAFGNCTDLRYVLLPDTIKTIENYAFSDCASLVAVSLPKSLISIGNCSFVNCTALTNLSFPDTLTEIGSLAFGSCSSLQHVILPKGIKEIAESAFAGCANLVSVTCQDSLTIIGYKAFDGCVSLKNLTLSKNLEEIGWAAFRDCRQLNSLALPDRLSTIEYAAFDGCPNLKYLYVPDSVEKIGVGADGTLAFESETTLICPEGSCAETYAQMYFLRYATGGYSIWNGILEMAQNMDISIGTTEGPLEYYTVLTSKRTYLYPRMDEESEAMLRIPGQMLISAVPAGDGWLKTEYAGIPGYVTTNNLKAYDLDKEYTWKEFQTMVNNALKACENGEVLVPGPKHVAAYKNGDKAITMPDGVKLIIEGGSFESMLVTNGSIELRNVTVNCARDERCAITVSIPSKERSLELLIDENSTITATGQYASAIGTDHNNTPSVKNAILNYRIVNNGRIESDGGSGIEIRNWSWGDNGEAQVYIENNGMILSRWWNGIRCNLCDQQELEIINRGSIESIGFGGIHIESGSFHITNESGAVIKGGSSTGAIWVVNSDADATISGSISNAGELQNLGVYTYVDFLPMIVYEGNDLEVSVRLTQIVRDKDEILTMEQTKEIAKELLRNIKNGSGYAFESAIIDLGTGERKFETEHEHTVYLESSEM